MVKARVADWQFNTTARKVDRKIALLDVAIRTPGDGSGLSKPGAKVEIKAGSGAATLGMPGMGAMGGMTVDTDTVLHMERVK